MCAGTVPSLLLTCIALYQPMVADYASFSLDCSYQTYSVLA
jgi:hypothetical protein